MHWLGKCQVLKNGIGNVREEQDLWKPKTPGSFKCLPHPLPISVHVTHSQGIQSEEGATITGSSLITHRGRVSDRKSLNWDWRRHREHRAQNQKWEENGPLSNVIIWHNFWWQIAENEVLHCHVQKMDTDANKDVKDIILLEKSLA